MPAPVRRRLRYVLLSTLSSVSGLAAQTLKVEALPLRSAVAPGASFEQSVLFRLQVAVPAEGNSTEESFDVDAQELCILLDTSESMVGRKLQAATHALAHLVRGLRDADRLHIVTFHHGARVELRGGTSSQRPRLLEVLKRLPLQAEAGRRLAARKPRNAKTGWTVTEARAERSDLLAGLDAAEVVLGTSESSGAQVPRRIFLLSDGLATEDDPGRWGLLARAEALQLRGVSLSAVAVGADRDTRLLRTLAKVGRGSFLALDGGAASVTALVSAVAASQAPAALDAVLWLSPEQGARALRVSGHRRRHSTSGEAIASPAAGGLGISERVPVGMLHQNTIEEILVDVQIPALASSASYLQFEFSASVRGSRQISSGRIRVHVRSAERPEKCEEHGHHEPLVEFPVIAGARWEAAPKWMCDGHDISSHVQAAHGQPGATSGRRWCAARCLSQPECVAFAYPHPGDGRCWLKGGGKLSRRSHRLDLWCGGPNFDWDYYTLLDRAPRCRTLACDPVKVSGVSVLGAGHCPLADPSQPAVNSPAAGNGIYSCIAAGSAADRHSYRLDADGVRWELLWESGACWGGRHLGQLEGFGGQAKWVLRGNGQYLYFSAGHEGLVPPRDKWRPRTNTTTDVNCATGTLAVEPSFRRGVFLRTEGLCADAGGGAIEDVRRIRLGELPRQVCEERCLADRYCAAYQFDLAGLCELIRSVPPESQVLAGGDGQPAGGSWQAHCFLLEQTTRFSLLVAGRRCQNAYAALRPQELSLQACVEAAAASSDCGHAVHFQSGRAGGCSCVKPGETCEEALDAQTDVYEIMQVFGMDQGVALLRSLHRLLEREEEADPKRQAQIRAGHWAPQLQQRTAEELDRLVARAKRLQKQGSSAVPLGIIERVMEVGSRRHWETAACTGAPALCRAAAPAGAGGA